jgi:hypothetical protein
MELQETGHDVDYSLPSSAEVKNEQNYTSALPVCLCLNVGQRVKFTVTLNGRKKVIKFWYMTATNTLQEMIYRSCIY